MKVSSIKKNKNYKKVRRPKWISQRRRGWPEQPRCPGALEVLELISEGNLNGMSFLLAKRDDAYRFKFIRD